MIKLGPVGGTATAWDDGGKVSISQIFVSHGQVINSLQYQYIENGALVLSEKHGGSDGHTSPKFTVVTLNYPSEFLTAISGSYGWFSALDGVQMQIVSSITFTTNIKTYGPFGCCRQNDAAFDFQLGQDNGFGGFHGIAGMYLNSIGVYVKPQTSVLDLDKAKIASGGGAGVAFSAPAAGGFAAAAAPAAAAVEEKKEEPKEESDDDMGFSLFD
ncbi:hypothetical protein RHMOL_Rhmol04G0371300 [Rhododendron molle]|nr:hypothetical protein RHMOL_Rhmol04G0371300 [Rhododendron molle]KAI8561822.1 hypothetical protein RHMOL_Rhmol04G0371300 [Rhododendron molle]